MEESLECFEETINSDNLKDEQIILLFTKRDLFKEKIKTYDIKDTFNDYEGGDDYDKGVDYFMKKFLSLNKYKEDRIHTFVVNVIDQDEMEKICLLIDRILLQIKSEKFKEPETVNETKEEILIELK